MKNHSFFLSSLACLLLLGCNSENVSNCGTGDVKCEKDASLGAVSYICNDAGQWLPLQSCKECKEDACSDEDVPDIHCDTDGQFLCLDLKDKSVQLDCIQNHLIPSFCKDKEKCDNDHCSELISECTEGEKSCVWIEEKNVAVASVCKDGQLQSVYCSKGIGCKNDACDMEVPEKPDEPEPDKPEEPAFCSAPGDMIEESTQNCICDTSKHWTGEAGSCKCEKGLVNINGVCDKEANCKGHGVTINKANACVCNASRHWTGKAGSCTCEKDHFEVAYKPQDHACCVPVKYEDDFNEPSCLELENPKKGDICLFGSYRQFRESEDKQPIHWRVLTVSKSNNILLMSEYAMDVKPYNKTKKAITWETCTLRSWLNAFDASSNTDGVDYSQNGFLKNAFTEDEQSHIINATIVNLDHPTAGTPGGNDTKDKVFLLSREEGRTYLGSARMVYGTSYATSKAQLVNAMVCRGEDETEFQYPLSQWHRSCSVTADQARCISAYNADCDLEVSYPLAVRPALWLKK